MKAETPKSQNYVTTQIQLFCINTIWGQSLVLEYFEAVVSPDGTIVKRIYHSWNPCNSEWCPCFKARSLCACFKIVTTNDTPVSTSEISLSSSFTTSRWNVHVLHIFDVTSKTHDIRLIISAHNLWHKCLSSWVLYKYKI